MKVTLHIGATKTGSSAVQAHLYKARDILRKEGILYPGIGIKSNAHHELIASIHPSAWGMHLDALSELRKDRFAYFRGAMAQIFDLAERSGAHHVVLSSEYLWGRVPGAFKAQLAEALAGHEVRLVAFLRRQDRWYEASYLQDVKSGQSLPFAEWLKKRRNAHFSGGGDYARVLRFWQTALSTDDIHVAPYEFADRTTYTRNALDLICDARVGARAVTGEAMLVNPSPNKPGLSALLALNQRKLPETDRGRLVSQLLRKMARPAASGAPLVFSAQEQRELLAQFEPGNRWLAKRFNPAGPESFFDMSDLQAKAR